MPRAGWVKPETDRRLSDLVSVGVLTRVFPPELVDEVIADVTSHLMHGWAGRDLPEKAGEWCGGVERALRQMIRDYDQPRAHVDGDQPSSSG